MSLSRTQLVAAVVLDKTGYTLTSQSYSIRASSTQLLVFGYGGAGNTNKTSAISAVTLTRTSARHSGFSTTSSASADFKTFCSRVALDSSTQASITRGAAPNTENGQVTVCIEELF